MFKMYSNFGKVKCSSESEVHISAKILQRKANC